MLKKIPAVFFAVALVSACTSSPARLAGLLNERVDPAFSDTNAVSVLVVTNRATARTPACSDSHFGVTGQRNPSYVSCTINVPKKHPIGALDETDEPAADPHSFFFVTGMQTLQEQELLTRAAASKEVLVFVHGFNVPFSEALYRAAQIKYDLKFAGAVILFSWPAGADEGFLSALDISGTYKANRMMAELTRPIFSAFLNNLSKSTTRIHIMVHSMGHEVVLPALASSPSLRIDQLILNAPDFSLDEFARIAPVLTKISQRVTLYCSPGDNALVASEKINSARRIGRCAKVPGVDVINVNEVDAPALGVGGLGHGYYSGRAILTDVYQVLMGVDVTRRLFVRTSFEYGGEDYVLRR
jgi:esterase/lipase superfamily enzyme